MLQLTGIKRARESWPHYMNVVDDSRDEGEDYTLRGQTQGWASFFHPTPEWYGDLFFRHGNFDELQYEYGQTLNLMAAIRVRMIWNRFIINLRRLIGRRKHRPHSASLLGAW